MAFAATSDVRLDNRGTVAARVQRSYGLTEDLRQSVSHHKPHPDPRNMADTDSLLKVGGKMRQDGRNLDT
jgi:hypothetical protein